MGFPLMVRAIRLSIEAVDARLEEAAGTLGASRAWVFLTVTLPLIVPGIIAGMILCFAKAMGEFGATITFVSNIPGETQTLPSAIYTFTQVPGGDAGRVPADARLDRHRHAGAARIRADGALCQPAARHRMTLSVEIQHRLGSFQIDARFEKKAAPSASRAAAVRTLVKLVAPMAPHLAEEAWAALGEAGMVDRGRVADLRPGAAGRRPGDASRCRSTASCAIR